MRFATTVVFAVTLSSLLGCDNSGLLLGQNDDSAYTIDTSDLGDAEVLVAYSGRLRLSDFYGETQWTLVSGDLPSGLGLGSDGSVTGTPTWVGRFSFTVQVTGDSLDGVDGEAEIGVIIGGAPVALGYDRDQTTSLTEDNGLMWDMWLRLDEAGEDQWSYTFDPGLYHAGADGVHNGGRGDDIRVGDVPIDEVEVVVGEWQAIDDAEDSPPEYQGMGTFQAGTDTGESDVQLEHTEYGTVDTRIFVTAPDWCPMGEHPGGGPNNPGVCA